MASLSIFNWTGCTCEDDEPDPPTRNTLRQEDCDSRAKIEHRSIPYGFETVPDNNMRLGETREVQKGKDGEKSREVRYNLDVVANDCKPDYGDWRIDSEPVNRIIARGTYVDPIIPEATPPPVIVPRQQEPSTGYPSCDCSSYSPECASWQAENCYSDDHHDDDHTDESLDYLD